MNTNLFTLNSKLWCLEIAMPFLEFGRNFALRRRKVHNLWLWKVLNVVKYLATISPNIITSCSILFTYGDMHEFCLKMGTSLGNLSFCKQYFSKKNYFFLLETKKLKRKMFILKLRNADPMRWNAAHGHRIWKKRT